MQDNRLPKTKKEGIIYGGVIAIITVIVMVFLNITLEFKKIDGQVLFVIAVTIPIFWIVAMLLENFVIGRISEQLLKKFTLKTDGFNTKILFNILFCVTGMSFIMTIIGGIYGEILSIKSITLKPILDIPLHWPRNFFVAFWCEILLAQPLARFVMKKIHLACEKTKNEMSNSDVVSEALH